MLCQHCGNAPCEPVCPVYATYHAPDGLNVQVYNRCVGTRYCCNNCPYKVRYFNWFGYGEEDRKQYAFPEPLNWQLNPGRHGARQGRHGEVHVLRAAHPRGGERARSRRVASWSPDEFTTACAQACPSRAIVFGDAADPNVDGRAAGRGPARLPRVRGAQHLHRGGLLEEGQPSGAGDAGQARKGARRWQP